MKRYLSLVVITLLLSIGLIAQQGPGPRPNAPGPNGPNGQDGPRGGEKLIHCLTILDLTEDQQTQIQGILETAKPQVEALREDARAAHEALRDAIDSGADECTVGAALLEVHANRTEMQTLREQVKEDIFAVLSNDQQLKLSGCLEAPGRGRGPGPGGPQG